MTNSDKLTLQQTSVGASLRCEVTDGNNVLASFFTTFSESARIKEKSFELLGKPEKEFEPTEVVNETGQEIGYLTNGAFIGIAVN